MAEITIKLSEKRFKDIHNQSADVKKFFNNFSTEDKKKMRELFYKSDKFLNKRSLTFLTITNILLNVRHRLVHGKAHYEFIFNNGQENLYNPIWGEVDSKNSKGKQRIRYELDLTYEQFKELMIKNAILIIEKFL